MTGDDKQLKHLEMIQEIISRMSRNSFQFKGWAIMIMSALLALFANSGNPLFIAVSIIPIIIFWIIDSFYLQQERKYVWLYDKVVKYDKTVISYSMSTSKCQDSRCNFWNCFFSKTTAWFYGASTAFLLIAFLLIYTHIVEFTKLNIN
jgi:hypothetical protein